jgi:DNA-binding MarR family transcriptional regulator
MATPLNLSHFVPYLLSTTSNAVSDLIAREYQARFGLRIPEWRIMAVLGQSQPMTQRDLVQATLMDKVTVSRAAAVLVDRTLVLRSPSSSDGRSHQLRLSGTGVALYEEIVPAALTIETTLLAVLSEDERAQLADMLNRLRQAVDQLLR